MLPLWFLARVWQWFIVMVCSLWNQLLKIWLVTYKFCLSLASVYNYGLVILVLIIVITGSSNNYTWFWYSICNSFIWIICSFIDIYYFLFEVDVFSLITITGSDSSQVYSIIIDLRMAKLKVMYASYLAFLLFAATKLMGEWKGYISSWVGLLGLWGTS